MTVDAETGADRPICGWGLADGSLCKDPREDVSPELADVLKRCVEHNKSHYQICAGCAGTPRRTCDQFCHLPLCEDCHHQPDGSHSAEPPGPFAAQQRPATDPVNQVREQMIDVVVEGLERCAVRGLCWFADDENAVRRVAGVIVDRQATKALLTLQEGMAAASVAQGARSS